MMMFWRDKTGYDAKLGLLLFLTTLLFGSLLPASAQEKAQIQIRSSENDSALNHQLITQLMAIRSWGGGNKDSLEGLLSHTLQLSKYLQNDSVTSEVLFFLGLQAKKEGQYEQARDYYLEAIPYTFKAQLFTDRLPRIYNNLGDITTSLGNYPLAASYFYAALNLLPKPLDKNETAMVVYSGIAGLHMRYHEHRKALKYIQQSIYIARSINHRTLPKLLSNAANVYALLKVKDSAWAL